MSLLVRNEFLKLKRLKSIYVIFFLSFLPFLINGIGLLAMNENTDWNKFYMFVFNQYSILFPTVIFIFSGFYLHMESFLFYRYMIQANLTPHIYKIIRIFTLIVLCQIN
ncbi:ABC transporter permease [Bacillus velezensis]|uniref:ABC transporter permease n=1 Tax=Bacillus velezensis TaxID=492670 RepID=UPI0020232DA2|nr:ABC transporter permease [Bacillus velezensis]